MLNHFLFCLAGRDSVASWGSGDVSLHLPPRQGPRVLAAIASLQACSGAGGDKPMAKSPGPQRRSVLNIAAQIEARRPGKYNICFVIRATSGSLWCASREKVTEADLVCKYLLDVIHF